MWSPAAGVELRLRDIDSTTVHFCPETGGVWVDEATLCGWTLPLALMRAFDQREEAAPEQVYRVAGGARPPRRCPVCERVLLVVVWNREPGSEDQVEVDVCGRHGAWFDAGELERIREWARVEQAALAEIADAMRPAPLLHYLLRIVEDLNR